MTRCVILAFCALFHSRFLSLELSAHSSIYLDPSHHSGARGGLGREVRPNHIVVEGQHPPLQPPVLPAQ